MKISFIKAAVGAAAVASLAIGSAYVHAEEGTSNTADAASVSGGNSGPSANAGSGSQKSRLEMLLMKHRAKMQNASGSPKVPGARDTRAALRSLDGTCIQDLVAERDEKLYTAFGAFSTSILAAMDERRTAVFDAWGMDDAEDRADAIEAAWKEWKADSRAAHSTLKTDRRKAWDAFRTDARAECKVSVPTEESLEKDAAGSIAL